MNPCNLHSFFKTSTSTFIKKLHPLFKFLNKLQKYIGTGLQLARLFETGQATWLHYNKLNKYPPKKELDLI